MKLRKSLTVVGAALTFATIGTPAMAAGFDWDNSVCGNADATALELIELSAHLRCGDEAPSWMDDPIWEKRGEGSCEVQDSLADKLWIEPPRNDGNTDKKGKGPGKVAEGAAQKVLDEKYDEAVTKLEQLLAAIVKSKPNRGFEPGGVDAATAISNQLEGIVEFDAIPCVKQLLQP